MITILNTSILTDFGKFEYTEISLEQAKEMTKKDFQSAIGHKSTADVISTLLNLDCPMNRIMYKQKVGDTALIFKLNGRPEEGKILSKDEIEKIGYSWGKIKRTF